MLVFMQVVVLFQAVDQKELVEHAVFNWSISNQFVLVC